MKYLNFYKEFSKKVKPLRIRYRGNSKQGYSRPTFAIWLMLTLLLSIIDTKVPTCSP